MNHTQQTTHDLGALFGQHDDNPVSRQLQMACIVIGAMSCMQPDAWALLCRRVELDGRQPSQLTVGELVAMAQNALDATRRNGGWA